MANFENCAEAAMDHLVELLMSPNVSGPKFRLVTEGSIETVLLVIAMLTEIGQASIAAQAEQAGSDYPTVLAEVVRLLRSVSLDAA